MKSSTLNTKGFKFKQFSIEGGQSGMPVSTDGVLLGSWAFQDSKSAKMAPLHILDIGTGTGLLALMCAQRFLNAEIHAIDIDQHAYHAAKINISHSPWAKRIVVEQADILNLTQSKTFDAIICNPPYFNDGEHSQHAQRATARHTKTLEHKQLILISYQLLSEHGIASFILPITEGEQFIALAKESGFHLSRLCKVQPAANKPVSRLLFELQKQETNTEHSELIIRDELGYTQAFTELTRSFYLKM
ncbi:tRNA1(Val) (adenine(37)-N6)-methyltransferase [Vibrio diazotrophicus]|uniref:tRNA1(Val) (adenine(37)-N6)-methyltransferase n=1 Tax=Vibrio diazotrophicus TaxID=685 RepID=UPI000C9E6DC3|nr:methyltransferase [Vibrio diazotrophicus]PNH96179.1 tRNA (adenosine(37)-N6)-methyltransferase TrmM [Vibrio diazotrophicus]